MGIPNYIFSLFAFIGFLMCVIPLKWHLEAWNAGTCLYMIWVGLACLNQFINSVVWNNDAIIRAVVWCDISTKFMIGVNVAVPACSLCISRRLYLISTAKQHAPTKKEKMQQVYVDLVIGIGIPVIFMALHYIVQGHRFDILGEAGCYPSTHYTPLAVLIVSIPPIILGLVSSVYALLTIRAFMKAREHLQQVLSSRNITITRYIRHISLAGVQIMGPIPLATYVLSVIIRRGVSPWLGWDDTHWGFSRIDQVPAIIWRSSDNAANVEFTRWINIACAFIFFSFFGFAAEARKNYRSAYNYCAKYVGLPVLRPRRSSLDLLEAQIKSDTRFLPIVIPEVVDIKDYSTDYSPSTISSEIICKLSPSVDESMSVPSADHTKNGPEVYLSA